MPVFSHPIKWKLLNKKIKIRYLMMIRYLFKTKQQTGNTNNHPSWQKVYLAYTPHRSAYVWEGPWPKTYIRLPVIIIHEPFFGYAANPQRPSSTNENEITSRTQYTLDFHHVPRSFGYIKQVEKRTCQREAFVYLYLWRSWFRFFLLLLRGCRSLYTVLILRGRVLLLVVVTRIYNDKVANATF